MLSFLGGVQVLKEEMLQDAESNVRTILGNKHSLAIEKYRDIMKLADFGVGNFKADFLLIGLENQSRIDYAMPVRVGMYDFMNYENQIAQIEKKHRKKKEYGENNDEFLSGFQHQDKLIPVITIVLYYGKKKWDGPKNLKDMLHFEGVSKEVRRMLPNYPMHVLSIHELGEKRLNRFQSQLKQIFGFLKYEDDMKKLQRFVEKNQDEFHQLDQESFQMIQAFSDTQLHIKEEKKGGRVDMCKALDDMREESMLKGKRMGIKEGWKEGRKEGIKESLLKLYYKQKITKEDVCEELHITDSEFQKMLMQA